ncbi:alpha-amylase [Aliikangiella marina]|uniref:Alpha-amylase n=1 Tax=Aliikangiella marina TaxID=1712262 RepID=A0A545TCU3_9GAMM|nr:alpha-amylase family protein [Aliikangiella marina]TQV75040.1 alpha-amylase [Aliikangiella marina]
MKKIGVLFVGFALVACTQQPNESHETNTDVQIPKVEKAQSQQNKTLSKQGKPVVYQVFTRLFGNKNSTNKPWGTIEENGVGKFNDFTDQALKGIKEFGVTHIWYTGVPHHAVITDYSAYGISNDDPDVVKGRAGSPYAVKDYYNVNPDLAVDPAKRLEEFEALIKRTHQHGMKVIIDIVPNHVARNYQSLSKPAGVEDFGASDDTSVEYKRDNNFYYVVGEAFKVPEPLNNYRPLGGDKNPLADGKFEEVPAKWTGNGARKAQPHFHDWYETVKVNYGVRPDGRYDFDRLPETYRTKSYQEHVAFWQDKSVPNSWKKFREIVLYWTVKGVDGFRYDMAEMVPVEFWSYLNASIKQVNPDAFLLAEVYNPDLYRDYLQLGKMDYLYDKVDLYDTLKPIMQGKQVTSAITPIIERFADIDTNLLHFLENHDEQRIASPDFAGDALKGKPAMVVSALIGKGPTMLYFAQALGEPGKDDAGFGDPTRTTIFDYFGVPSLQRWMNNGKFDGGLLSEKEKKLRTFYTRLLSYSASSSAVTGDYADLHATNLSRARADKTSEYDEKLYSFARWTEQEKLIVVSNFSDEKSYSTSLSIPVEVLAKMNIPSGDHSLMDIMSGATYSLSVSDGVGEVKLTLKPLQSLVLQM